MESACVEGRLVEPLLKLIKERPAHAQQQSNRPLINSITAAVKHGRPVSLKHLEALLEMSAAVKEASKGGPTTTALLHIFQSIYVEHFLRAPNAQSPSPEVLDLLQKSRVIQSALLQTALSHSGAVLGAPQKEDGDEDEDSMECELGVELTMLFLLAQYRPSPQFGLQPPAPTTLAMSIRFLRQISDHLSKFCEKEATFPGVSQFPEGLRTAVDFPDSLNIASMLQQVLLFVAVHYGGCGKSAQKYMLVQLLPAIIKIWWAALVVTGATTAFQEFNKIPDEPEEEQREQQQQQQQQQQQRESSKKSCEKKGGGLTEGEQAGTESEEEQQKQQQQKKKSSKKSCEENGRGVTEGEQAGTESYEEQQEQQQQRESSKESCEKEGGGLAEGEQAGTESEDSEEEGTASTRFLIHQTCTAWLGVIEKAVWAVHVLLWRRRKDVPSPKVLKSSPKNDDLLFMVACTLQLHTTLLQPLSDRPPRLDFQTSVASLALDAAISEEPSDPRKWARHMAALNSILCHLRVNLNYYIRRLNKSFVVPWHPSAHDTATPINLADLHELFVLGSSTRNGGGSSSSSSTSSPQPQSSQPDTTKQHNSAASGSPSSAPNPSSNSIRSSSKTQQQYSQNSAPAASPAIALNPSNNTNQQNSQNSAPAASPASTLNPSSSTSTSTSSAPQPQPHQHSTTTKQSDPETSCHSSTQPEPASPSVPTPSDMVNGTINFITACKLLCALQEKQPTPPAGGAGDEDAKAALRALKRLHYINRASLTEIMHDFMLLVDQKPSLRTMLPSHLAYELLVHQLQALRDLMTPVHAGYRPSKSADPVTSCFSESTCISISSGALRMAQNAVSSSIDLLHPQAPPMSATIEPKATSRALEVLSRVQKIYCKIWDKDIYGDCAPEAFRVTELMKEWVSRTDFHFQSKLWAQQQQQLQQRGTYDLGYDAVYYPFLTLLWAQAALLTPLIKLGLDIEIDEVKDTISMDKFQMEDFRELAVLEGAEACLSLAAQAIILVRDSIPTAWHDAAERMGALLLDIANKSTDDLPEFTPETALSTALSPLESPFAQRLSFLGGACPPPGQPWRPPPGLLLSQDSPEWQMVLVCWNILRDKRTRVIEDALSCTVPDAMRFSWVHQGKDGVIPAYCANVSCSNRHFKTLYRNSRQSGVLMHYSMCPECSTQDMKTALEESKFIPFQ